MYINNRPSAETRLRDGIGSFKEDQRMEKLLKEVISGSSPNTSLENHPELLAYIDKLLSSFSGCERLEQLLKDSSLDKAADFFKNLFKTPQGAKLGVKIFNAISDKSYLANLLYEVNDPAVLAIININCKSKTKFEDVCSIIGNKGLNDPSKLGRINSLFEREATLEGIFKIDPNHPILISDINTTMTEILTKFVGRDSISSFTLDDINSHPNVRNTLFNASDIYNENNKITLGWPDSHPLVSRPNISKINPNDISEDASESEDILEDDAMEESTEVKPFDRFEPEAIDDIAE